MYPNPSAVASSSNSRNRSGNSSTSVSREEADRVTAALSQLHHEKQEGRMCAVHAVNSLLQAPIYSAVDLAEVARDFDRKEAEALAEGDTTSEVYKAALAEASNNYADDGYFSVHVLERVIQRFGLSLVNTASSEYKTKSGESPDPLTEVAFVCNQSSHWLTLRKVSQWWWNLNSLLPRPALITDAYLTMFLQTLKESGYTVFAVKGPIPRAEAEETFSLLPHDFFTPRNAGLAVAEALSETAGDAALARSLAESFGDIDVPPPVPPPPPGAVTGDEEDVDELAYALALSMEGK